MVAFLVWPMSQQDSNHWFERIGFCLLSILGVAFLLWGIQQPTAGFQTDFGRLTINGFVITIMAAIFLLLLWIERFNGMLTDLVIGCLDFSDHRPWDLERETKQIEAAFQLYRSGKRRRALRLCNRIIASNSQYASTAATLAHWIENPVRLKIIEPPRTTIKFAGSLSKFNGFWTM